MYPSLPNTPADPLASSDIANGRGGRVLLEGDTDPLMTPIAMPHETISSDRHRKRKNPVLMGVIVFVLVMIVGILGHWWWTGHWTLPGVRELPQMPASSPVAAAPVSPAQVAPAPPVVDPIVPVSQDIPTWIVIRRGDTKLVSSQIDGAYVPSGRTVDPSGDNPVWIGTSSKVGTDMKIPAVIAGHAQQGNDAMPFTALGMVQPGDLIDVMVPSGVVTFAVDTNPTPDKGMVGFPPENDTLKVVSCVVPVGGQNVLLSAHLVSSQAA